jgi:hypothetical protein
LREQNVSVTDVSLYVALITGAAGAFGAATPQLATVLRESKQAKRDRQERAENARQQACIELLGAAAGLRTHVENTAMYGGKILVRLAKIRSNAADVQVKAAKVSFLADKLATPAGTLASAAAELAADAIQKTNTSTGVMSTPSFAAFETAVNTFKSEALGQPDG